MKILIVDDAKAVHAFISALFKGVPVELAHCYDGLEAVQLVEGGESFDMVFLDWEMPNLDGMDTLKKLRSLGFQAPIVMVTSKNDLAGIEAAMASGAQEYVMKPFTRDILFEKVGFVSAEFQSLLTDEVA